MTAHRVIHLGMSHTPEEFATVINDVTADGWTLTFVTPLITALQLIFERDGLS